MDKTNTDSLPVSVSYIGARHMIPKKLATWPLKWSYCVWTIWGIRFKVPQKQTMQGTFTTGHRHLLKTSYDCVRFCLTGAHSPRTHKAICANTDHNRKAPLWVVRYGCVWKCDLWASRCQATSWIILCLLEINFRWSHTEVETTAFEYLHPANKIYVPWKAKRLPFHAS